ncbi:MAG: hypothetical protein KF889_27235 [Alphaproteobacteria bacterium]|nr:hypothetical protein [Alphaproteobacteria bacterium]MCW5738686.1 hypothetical protein [Alphaproteobacteria bacterium]
MAATGAVRSLDWIDTTLIVIFLAGLYLGVSLPITSKIPLTCAPSGFAGMAMLWRRRDEIGPTHLVGLFLVVALYLGSIFTATDFGFLGKRSTGLLQLVYSLVIGYALFLTMARGERGQIAMILLGFCLFIIVGCLLETHGGLRPVSNAVRERIFDAAHVYDADLRDEILYGKVRPKLFTSEPSAVTFGFTLFASLWLVTSPWRYKLLIYAGLIGAALLTMPGPTLVLMLLLAIPYFIFLAGTADGARRGSAATRLIGAIALSAVVLGVAVWVGSIFFAERLNELASGRDASFFYRFTGPMLVAFEMFDKHPWAGAGLTGEPYIAHDVVTVYMNAPGFQSAWRIPKIGDVLTNYFWLHWIYLGLVWGCVIIVGISLWLRILGVPSVLYCWACWTILGQASGAYVGPKTWAVLFTAAAASILVTRPSGQPRQPVEMPTYSTGTLVRSRRRAA